MEDRKIPDILRIKNGKLFCSDGTKLNEYLKAWATAAEVSDSTAINLIRGDFYKSLVAVFDKFVCGFCGRHHDKAKQLIEGKGCFICDKCVETCRILLAEKEEIKLSNNESMPPGAG